MINTIRKISIFILLLTFNYEASCQSYFAFIEKIKSYQDQVMLKAEQPPKHFSIDTTTFNLSTYFGLFDKLELKPNLKLYCTYCDFGTYGQPALYVRYDSLIIEDFIEQHLDNFYKSTGYDKSDIPKDVNDFRRDEILFGFAEDSVNKAKNNIIPDDSKFGYLQFLYFHLFGENFALKWHSNYTKGNVIFSGKEMERLYNFYNTSGDLTVEKGDLKKLKRLLTKRFGPVVKMTDKSCTISWYESFLHLGFYKRTYKIERQAPYKIEKTKDLKIASPKIGLVY